MIANTYPQVKSYEINTHTHTQLSINHSKVQLKKFFHYQINIPKHLFN